jgi:hypothetical protein
MRQTLAQIIGFLFFYILVLFLFGNAFMMIEFRQQSYNRSRNEDYEDSIPAFTEYKLIDTILFMWRLGLGDFLMDDVAPAGKSVLLVWVLFFVSTIISNIVFLNVLIAIVSDVYSKITEGRERYALMQQT